MSIRPPSRRNDRLSFLARGGYFQPRRFKVVLHRATATDLMLITRAVMDITRFGSQYQSPGFTLARTVENYQTYYDIPFPGLERQSGRPLKISPVYPVVDGIPTHPGHSPSSVRHF